MVDESPHDLDRSRAFSVPLRHVYLSSAHVQQVRYNCANVTTPRNRRDVATFVMTCFCLRAAQVTITISLIVLLLLIYIFGIFLCRSFMQCRNRKCNFVYCIQIACVCLCACVRTCVRACVRAQAQDGPLHGESCQWLPPVVFAYINEPTNHCLNIKWLDSNIIGYYSC